MEERQNIVVPKDFLDHLSETQPSKWKLIVNPDLYIKDAISCLQDQLSSCRSEKRRKKLEQRIETWYKELKNVYGDKVNEAKSSEETIEENTSSSDSGSGGA